MTASVTFDAASDRTPRAAPRCRARSVVTARAGVVCSCVVIAGGGRRGVARALLARGVVRAIRVGRAGDERRKGRASTVRTALASDAVGIAAAGGRVAIAVIPGMAALGGVVWHEAVTLVAERPVDAVHVSRTDVRAVLGDADGSIGTVPIGRASDHRISRGSSTAVVSRAPEGPKSDRARDDQGGRSFHDVLLAAPWSDDGALHKRRGAVHAENRILRNTTSPTHRAPPTLGGGCQWPP